MSYISGDQWHKGVATLSDLYNVSPRRWGMRVTVYNDAINSGEYVLVFGHSSGDLLDNSNWARKSDTNSQWGAIIRDPTLLNFFSDRQIRVGPGLNPFIAAVFQYSTLQIPIRSSITVRMQVAGRRDLADEVYGKCMTAIFQKSSLGILTLVGATATQFEVNGFSGGVVPTAVAAVSSGGDDIQVTLNTNDAGVQMRGIVQFDITSMSET